MFYWYDRYDEFNVSNIEPDFLDGIWAEGDVPQEVYSFEEHQWYFISLEVTDFGAPLSNRKYTYTSMELEINQVPEDIRMKALLTGE